MATGSLLGSCDLPTEVTLGGRSYPIAHDFRDGIRFEQLIFDQRVPEGTKVALAIGLFFGEKAPAADLGEIVAAILDFYRCGKPEPPGDDEDTDQLYSYSHDYDLIFAAFLNAYAIDLLDPSTRLHWFKFRAMLAALPPDCQFVRVVGYRAAKLSPNMSAEERRHLLKMKRLHALPNDASSRPVEIKDEDAYRAALDAVIAAKLAAAEEASAE